MEGKRMKRRNGESGNRRKVKKLIYAVAPILRFSVSVFFLCILLLPGCSDKVKPGTVPVNRQRVEGVTVQAVHPSEIEDFYETSGTVKAKTISLISSRILGTVTSVRVKEGDRVRAGQTLITIDDRDLSQKVSAAEKALVAARQNKSLADITYQRYKKLFDDKALSQQEIDQIEAQKKIAEADYERSRAMLNEARVSHEFASILSPVSGIVTEKKTERGNMALPGTPLLTVEDTSSYILEASLDEHLAGKTVTGTNVNVVCDAIGRNIKGTIAEIVPSIDPASRTFLAKISLNDPALRSGLYARVSIPTGKKVALVVPGTAIVEKGQLTGIYVVDPGGVMSYRLVRTGTHYGNNIEVLSGINADDRIITDNLSKAVDGGIIGGAVK